MNDHVHKFSVSMPENIYKKIAELAARERRSVSNYISLVCEQALSEQERDHEDLEDCAVCAA
jgi:metal-responsive CopG/Arc/MetJ family transcriptional regulator